MSEETSDKEATALAGYHYSNATAPHTMAYLLPTILRTLEGFSQNRDTNTRVIEVGCGNGAIAARLAELGYSVVGIDPSKEGVRIASQAYPQIAVHCASCYDDLLGKFGSFPIVMSLEVIEHVFFPRKFASCIYSLLEPGGIAIISTPYHSYLKNLALAVTGKMDQHFTALWHYGHIKFWSMKTLRTLLQEAGFQDVRFIRVGRLPQLAKSMIAVAKRPKD